ncbi:MAG: transcriptional repressor LexA [bacterium]|jgi:repressor LexA|nr:transcriptional repressor LexA [bacterium]
MSPRGANDNLTSRQEELLAYLRQALEKGGTPPSYRELGERFGIKSTNGVKVLLDALERKGYLLRVAGRARALELTPAALAAGRILELSVRSVPLLGRVAAGEPILAVEHVEEMLQVDTQLLRGDEHFALEVRGDSMVEAGILDGDLVFAQVQDSARAGDMVVALIGEEATVKFYFPEQDRIRLQPANARYEPLFVEGTSPEFRIAGKVTGLMRRYR